MAFGHGHVSFSSVACDTSRTQPHGRFYGNQNLSEKSLQNPSLAPIVGPQAVNAYYVSLPRQHPESDLDAGRNSSLGMNDCEG